VSTSDDLKRAAAVRALACVHDGMTLGLGTGSTAAHFVALLGERIRAENIRVLCVPTSEQTRLQALEEGIPLTTLEETPQLDLTVDGADELDDKLRLIKGGGGALLREKIVAAASKRMIVIADESKKVDILGAFPLPVEVVKFGWQATRKAIAHLLQEQGLSVSLTLRKGVNDLPFLTDEGHIILDAAIGPRLEQPEVLSLALAQVTGVVDHGLFIGLATGAVLASPSGVVTIGDI
jgi:ribose 5-phosphate isomerase A